MNTTAYRTALLTSLLTAAVVMSGCDFGAPLDLPPAGTVSGTISYDGVVEGILIVEAHDAMPPVGPALATATLSAPRFPQPFELTGLDPDGAELFLTARLAGTATVGTFPSVLEVSPVVLEAGRGLRGADFWLLDEPDRPDGPVTTNEPRTLRGTIHFDGLSLPDDVLRGALYSTFPVHGTPADFQIVNEPDPEFPFAFIFSDVRDGTYFTVFYLDRGGNSPFGPGPEDLVEYARDGSGAPRASIVSLGVGLSGVDVVIAP